MMAPAFDVLTMGRVSVDLYPEQSGGALAEVRSFAKSLQPLGVFGDSLLKKPYGIAVYPAAEKGSYIACVTDNYEMVEDSVPPDSLLGERVRQFRLSVAPKAVTAQLTGTFGETSGPGVLKVVESISADVPNNRVLIAEELETASHIKVYTLDGKFTSQVIDSGLLPKQAEDIILYACGDTAGYWITTDQGMEANTFHVFDREMLAHVGSFQGAQTVAAFSWEAIADALQLRKDCGQPRGAAEPAS